MQSRGHADAAWSPEGCGHKSHLTVSPALGQRSEGWALAKGRPWHSGLSVKGVQLQGPGVPPEGHGSLAYRSWEAVHKLIKVWGWRASGRGPGSSIC